MSSISDRIEHMIKQMLEEGDGEILIVRNEMANRINVVPSQISYVLSTRFTNVQGYLTESKRGGGGGIVVKRVTPSARSAYLMHACNAIGDRVSFSEAKVLIQNFEDYGAIDQRVAAVFTAAVSNKALAGIDPYERNDVRAAIMKNVLAALAAE